MRGVRDLLGLNDKIDQLLLTATDRATKLFSTMFSEFFASFASFAVKPICGQADICRGEGRSREDDCLLRAGVASGGAPSTPIDAAYVHRSRAFPGRHARDRWT